MAPGLEHDEPAIAVEMLAGMPALGEDGRARDGRIAGDPQAHGFAAGMHLHRLDREAHGIAFKVREPRQRSPWKSTGPVGLSGQEKGGATCVVPPIRSHAYLAAMGESSVPPCRLGLPSGRTRGLGSQTTANRTNGGIL